MNRRPSSANSETGDLHLRNGFKSIYEIYRTFYRSLTKDGLQPYALTARGAWAASRPVHVFRFFNLMGLNDYRCFMDLGSGDGIVTHIAALFTRSTGIEIDESLCGTARNISGKLSLPHDVEFTCEDFMRCDLHGADCLYIYPDKPVHELEALLEDWDGTLLIYGPHFRPRKLQPRQQFISGRERLVLYGRS